MNKKIAGVFSLFGPFLGLIFVYLIFVFVAPSDSNFVSLYSTKTILTQTVIIAIGAFGMTLVIISGGIDLSVGSMVALGTVVTAVLLKKLGQGMYDQAHTVGVWLPLMAALAAVAVCAFCGFLSGAMISLFRIVPFIVTLGMMQIVRGVALGISDQRTVSTPPNWLTGLMTVEPAAGQWYSFAPGVWIMLFLLALMFTVLRYTVFGRRVFAIGSNEATARLCGIRVNTNRVWIYALCGALTGIASVMSYGNLSVGDPTGAMGLELDIIAAVVIGGGSLSGGEGSIVGSLVGALIIAILRSGCVAVGIPNFIQNIVIGAIIIVAVGVDQLKHSRAA